MNKSKGKNENKDKRDPSQNLKFFYVENKNLKILIKKHKKEIEMVINKT